MDDGTSVLSTSDQNPSNLVGEGILARSLRFPLTHAHFDCWIIVQHWLSRRLRLPEIHLNSRPNLVSFRRAPRSNLCACPLAPHCDHNELSSANIVFYPAMQTHSPEMVLQAVRTRRMLSADRIWGNWANIYLRNHDTFLHIGANCPTHKAPPNAGRCCDLPAIGGRRKTNAPVMIRQMPSWKRPRVEESQ